MANQRLLERLRTLDEKYNMLIDENELVVKSIISHIHDILSTRRGSVPISEEFGMPDICSSMGISFVESLDRISDAIVSTVKLYEPRLKNVSIQILSDKKDIIKQRFGLKGFLTDNPSVALEFEIIISSEAKVTISKI